MTGDSLRNKRSCDNAHRLDLGPPSGDHPAAAGARHCGHGRVSGAGDRPGDAGDCQDAGATGRRPGRAHRDAHPEWKREHQLQPERGHDQRAECRDLQRGPGNSLFNRRNCSSRFGSYDYNQTTADVSGEFPADQRLAGRRRSSATVTSNSLPGAFSKILKAQFLPNVSATAQAVHRPRDIALVMDLSGSMRLGTCLGFDFYTTSRTSNNPGFPDPDIRPLLLEQRRHARAEHQSNVIR